MNFTNPVDFPSDRYEIEYKEKETYLPSAHYFVCVLPEYRNISSDSLLSVANYRLSNEIVISAAQKREERNLHSMSNAIITTRQTTETRNETASEIMMRT